MEGHVAELTGIAIVLAVSTIVGIIFLYLKQPPIVGYILGGVVLGPTGLGLVRATESVLVLAELGVVLLLFLIGMELSLRAFMLVLRPAVLTVVGQIAVSLGITFGFGAVFGWPLQQSLLLGFIVSISSTAVTITMLESFGEMRSMTGRITVGVLIAQDIAVVPMIILIGSMGGGADPDYLGVAIKLALALGVLVLVLRFLSRRKKITLPFSRAVQGRSDVVAVAAIALCFAAGAISALFGMSAAFGAFVAGLLVANSTLRSEAIAVTHPIQSVLVVVFFLSIGLLIDLNYVWANLWPILLFVLGILIAKSLVNVLLLHAVGEPWERAFPAGLMMAQIGEFSFVLAAIGASSGVINVDGYRFSVTVIAISLLVSPLWMSIVRHFLEVAKDGITDFRTALGETYQAEMVDLGRGATALKRRWLRLRIAERRRRRAMGKAWRLNRERRRASKKAEKMAKVEERFRNLSDFQDTA
ncbi:cation:proton antiporter [Rhodobium gokarnense]|uniref:CPA2 family monovalent cation:H+ antiporter-2 n=1 Tax=Rhodobium gokarnense TaxID=364296 RepID=A0ABT3HC04_9HYPH|nr:cation:proton antiporter [Rhodobium gokarnense]MCW2307931.1 CPA2 family monovalent cation:H+ antiporter-2 [Rhodobium gokarnense]